MTRRDRMQALLTQELSPNHIEIIDDSAKHHGHAGARPEGQTHYTLVVESERFRGLGKVQRHQLVYGLLAGEFKQGLHALAITARAPGEPA